MKHNGRIIPGRAAAALLLIPFFLVTGCQKQNNNAQRTQAQQTHEQPAQENLAGGRGGRQKIRIVCADDIQKYCANADRKRRCLKENMDKLSDACKAAVARRGGGRRARDNSGDDD